MGGCYENPCLLGLLDEEIHDDSTLDWMANRVGGRPIWMSCVPIDTPNPSCVLCDNGMLLVTQLYCPIGNCNFHRALYIFCCISPKCWGMSESWKVFRCQQPCRFVMDAKASSVSTYSNDPWLPGQADWSDSESDTANDEEHSLPESLLPALSNIELQSELEDLDTNPLDLPTDSEVSIKATELETAHEGANIPSNSRDTLLPSSLSDMMLNAAARLDTRASAVRRLSLQEEIDYSSIAEIGSMEDQGKSKVLAEPLVVPSDSGMFLQLDSNQQNQECDEEIECIFKSFYVSVVDEPENQAPNNHAHDLLLEYQSKEDNVFHHMQQCSFPGVGLSQEHYERSEVKHGDNVFHKLLTRMALCPQQIIRYNRLGQPLYLTSVNAAGAAAPPCQACGDSRVFEMQLMPTLLRCLRSTNPAIDVPLVEFGTVVISTCQNSCWEEGAMWKEEHIFVQCDPDDKLFTRWV